MKAILDRELRIAARQKSTRVVRFLAPFLLATLWFVICWTGSHRSAQQLGYQTLIGTTILALAGALFAGPFLTADSISAEKREGTLGLLFLTHLRPMDVILGKFFSTFIQAFYVLLAIFPVLALPLMLGGVSFDEFFRLLVLLITTFTFSLSIGLFISSRTFEMRHAFVSTFFTLILLSGGGPLIGMAAKYLLKGQFFLPCLISPPALLPLAFDRTSTIFGSQIRFWDGISCLWFLTLTALAMLVVKLPVCASDIQRPTEQTKALKEKVSFSIHDPFIAFYSRSKGSTWLRAVYLLVAVLVMVLTAAAVFAKATGPFVVAMFTAVALHMTFKILMAVESCRSIGEDKKVGALEILLVTPASISKFMMGHIFGVNLTLKQLRSTLYAINIFFLSMVLLLPSRLSMHGKDQAIFVIIFLGGIGVLAADVWSMGWLALLFGAQKTKPSQAIFAIVARLILGPWILALLFLFYSMGIRMRDTGAMTMFSLWFVAAIISSLLFGLSAREKLRGRRFHRLVAEPELQGSTGTRDRLTQIRPPDESNS